MISAYVWYELALKALYACGFFVNLAGLVTGSPLLRRVGLPLCPAALVGLLFAWRMRLGWVNHRYAYCVLLALVLMLFADLLMAEPLVDYLTYPGFLVFCCATLMLAVAMSLPTKPKAFLDFKVPGDFTTGRMKMAAKIPAYVWRASRIPLHLSRALLPFSLAIAVPVVWRLVDPLLAGPGENPDSLGSDPRYIATTCVVLLHGLLVWRALARVGYGAPLITVGGLLRARQRRKAAELAYEMDAYGYADSFMEDDDDGDSYFGEPSSASWRNSRAGNRSSRASPSALRRASSKLRAQRAERNRRQAAEESSAVESRLWQWCGVVGAVFLSLGLLALGYDRLWLKDDPTATEEIDTTAGELSVLHAVLSWLGSTLVAASVPCGLPSTGTLDDPVVSPTPTDGPALKVLIVLPGNGLFDAREVAVPWYTLTRRGHTVLFATRHGRLQRGRRKRLPLPTRTSVHGYGCLACGDDDGACGCGTYATSVTRSANIGSAGGAGAAGRYIVAGTPSADAVRLLRSNSTAAAVAAQEREAGECGGIGGALCCCCGTAGLGCSAAELGVGVGAPGPLIVAMTREMMESPAYRKPLAWKNATAEEVSTAVAAETARKNKRKGGRNNGSTKSSSGNSSRSPGRNQQSAAVSTSTGTDTGSDSDLLASAFGGSNALSGSGKGGGSEGSSGEGSDSLADGSTFVANPDAFDGVILAGALPACSGDDVFDDPDLQAFVGACWSNGRPVAAFSSAVGLLARVRDVTGRPLFADALMTSMTRSMEWVDATLRAALGCSWMAFCVLCRGRGWARSSAAGGHRGREALLGGSGSVEDWVRASLADPAHYLAGPPLFDLRAWLVMLGTGASRVLRRADPFDDTACFVVEDGALLTAQGGADAFLLSRRFILKLEEVARVF